MEVKNRLKQFAIPLQSLSRRVVVVLVAIALAATFLAVLSDVYMFMVEALSRG